MDLTFMIFLNLIAAWRSNPLSTKSMELARHLFSPHSQSSIESATTQYCTVTSCPYKKGSVDLGYHTRCHTPVRTGYPHTPTQGNTTTLKRRQGAHAPGTMRYNCGTSYLGTDGRWSGANSPIGPWSHGYEGGAQAGPNGAIAYRTPI